MYSLPGNINLTSKNYSFRTLLVNEVIGSNVTALNLEYNFRDEIFKLLNIPGLKKWEIQLNTFFNAAISEAESKTLTFIPVEVNEFKKPFFEIGFGLGHILLPMQVEFAWKLTHRGENNFRIGLNSFVF